MLALLYISMGPTFKTQKHVLLAEADTSDFTVPFVLVFEMFSQLQIVFKGSRNVSSRCASIKCAQCNQTHVLTGTIDYLPT